MTWDMESGVCGPADVIHELLSVFLMRNSHVAGPVGCGPAAASASSASAALPFFLLGGVGLGAIPVGALAMARKSGLVSSSIV